MAKSGSGAPSVDQRLRILAIVALFWLETRFVNVRQMATGLEKHQNVYHERSIDLSFLSARTRSDNNIIDAEFQTL